MSLKESQRKPAKAPRLATIEAARGMACLKPGGPTFAGHLAAFNAKERWLLRFTAKLCTART